MSDSEPDSGSDAPVQAQEVDGPSPGELLAAGRLARELTVEEVGDALNLAPQTVHRLEADDYAALPAAAFTQGYIRNYAKHVGLDADVVVAAYQRRAGKPDVAWQTPRSSAGVADLVERYPGLLISAVVAAVGVLVFIVLAIVWPEDDPDTASGAEATSQVGSAASPDSQQDQGGPATAAGVDGLSESAQAAGAPVGLDRTAPEAVDRAASGYDEREMITERDQIDPNDPLAHLPVAKTYPLERSRVTSGASAGVSERAVTRPQAQVDGSLGPAYGLTLNRRLTPEGNSEIRVEVTEDCWIAIKNLAGEELYAVLGLAGQTISLTGEGPFRVLLGYAPGASLYLDDRQILLDPYTRNNVASLVIGQ